MVEFLICAWSVSLVLTGVEELIRSLGKWRGLLALVVAGLAGYFTGVQDPKILVFYTMSTAFVGLVTALVVESTLTISTGRVATLPRRIPPL